jgi:hypothetical protein
VKEFWIEIFNNDDQSLGISSLQCWQLKRYCIAQLDKQKTYELRFGDSLLNAPQYDLRFFQTTIPDTRKTLVPSEIHEKTILQVAEVAPVFFKSRMFIWMALILVVAILSFVTARMLKHIK